MIAALWSCPAGQGPETSDPQAEWKDKALFPPDPAGYGTCFNGMDKIKVTGVKDMTMSKEAVKDKMKDANTVVLNVLPEGDYAKLHIKGSENLPLGQNHGDFVQTVEKRYGKNRFFITHCSGPTCGSGPNAAKALQAGGFKANDYAGGIQEWSEAGFPTEGTEAKSTAVDAPGPKSAASN